MAWEERDSAYFEQRRMCGRHVLIGATAQWTKPCAKSGKYVAVKLHALADMWTNGVVCRYHGAAIKGGRGSVGHDYKRGLVGLIPIDTVTDEALPEMLSMRYVHEEEENDEQ